jgi:nucleoside-diphosphate-sugar epimerase
MERAAPDGAIMTTSENRLLVLGAGYSALECARRAAPLFAAMTGTTRSSAKFGLLEKAGLAPLAFDGAASGELLHALENATHLLVSAAPSEDGVDPFLAALGERIEAAPRLAWVCYLSTVGVYGDHDGEWVDEDSELRPVSRRSRVRVAAERAWEELARRRRIPLAIFRLSGIYGPGRNAFVNIEAGTSRRLVKPGQVFNRIHRDDIANAFPAAARIRAGGAFNITDDEPSPPQDVVAFAHELAGVAPPPEQDFATAELSPMARSFYGENKRVSNARSKSVLKMAYEYPDYRSALTRMWRENTWK